MSDTIDSAKGRQVSSRQWAAIIAVIVLVIAALFASGAKAAFASNEPPSTQTTEHLPTQTIDCTAISADYHRPLQNGDHINVEIKQSNGSVGQVNAYVDQNIAGGASYNGQNNLGLRIKILGQEVDSIPLTLDQIMSGIITFNYAAYLKDRGVTQWTVTFVQTNSFDDKPNTECGETPPKPTPTPTHTVTPTPKPTETPKPTPEPTHTPKPTPTPTETPKPEPTPTETPKPTPEPTKTPSPEPTHTPKPTPTTSPSPEPTKTPSPEPSHTAGPSPEPSSSPSASAAPPVAPKPPSKGGGLAVTGAQVAGASGMGLAAILLAAGGVIWFFRRRRANTSE